jgi:SagB-type dehydrogenase family enzyme
MSNADVRAAWQYHNRTKHSYERFRSSPHVLDWQVQPLPFKIYKTLDPIPLPRDLSPVDVPALDAIAAIGTSRTDECVPDLVTLTQLLHYSAGITRRKRYSGGEIDFRAAPCTGALYHIDVYVVCGDLPGLEAGVYHFGPHDRALYRLRSGDHRRTLMQATAAEPAVAAAPLVLICASTFWRNAWKYQARTYRHCFWDAGTLLANVLAVAAARSVPAHVASGFVDATVNRLLGLDTDREVALALVAIGRTAAAPGPAPEMEPLGFKTVPLSTREVDYPAIREMHAASSLLTPAEVAAWRGPASGTRAPSPTGRIFALQPLAVEQRTREPIDRAITRRGSTRTFARESLDFRALSTMIHVSTRGVAADFLDAGSTLNELYLTINAVDGLPPGTYVVHRDLGVLELLREGNVRAEAGHLGLDQALPADASADVFLLTNLEPILSRYGNRGYRAAQLEAAIIGGKLYLAAYAQHLGATGLTFFDDDVTGFFSPHAAGKSVMFLTALGISARRRRPSPT